MPKMMIRSHLLLILALIPLLLFSAITLYYISGHHVWPLSRDQWHMYAPYFEQGFWETILSPMSTHRHIFPFFFFHLDMYLFNGLNHFLVACGALFNGLIIFLLLKSLSWEKALSFREKIYLGIFVITEMIWLLNIAQIGWGFMSTQYYLAILTFLLAIFCAHQFVTNQHRPVWIGLCISCGVVSTFSFGMGILVWPCLFYFIWLWRAPLHFALFIIIALAICLLLFFLLPGGDEIESSLLLKPMETLRFSLQLASGPVFHLLKSWRIFDLDTCKQIATVLGVSASITGLATLALTAWSRPSLTRFKQLCHAMIFLGLGTAALISLTRAPGFLDVWVDRYQIWATLLWTGLLPILYLSLKNLSLQLSRFLIFLLVSLPLLAPPSQLDMGSRLYEYNIRVQESLLFYQVGIPDKEAAQDALHWNWEHKLPFLFFVLEELKKRDKNIYYQNPAKYLASPLDALPAQWNIVPVIPKTEKVKSILKSQLLNREQYPSLQEFPAVLPADNVEIVGYKIIAKMPEEKTWKFAVSVNNKNMINGIGIRVYHSLLPRPSRLFIKRDYNFFAVVRYDNDQPIRWYLIDPQESSR